MLITEATDSQRIETSELGPASFQRNRRRGTDSTETRWPQECKVCPGDQTWDKVYQKSKGTIWETSYKQHRNKINLGGSLRGSADHRHSYHKTQGKSV